MGDFAIVIFATLAFIAIMIFYVLVVVIALAFILFMVGLIFDPEKTAEVLEEIWDAFKEARSKDKPTQ